MLWGKHGDKRNVLEHLSLKLRWEILETGHKPHLDLLLLQCLELRLRMHLAEVHLDRRKALMVNGEHIGKEALGRHRIVDKPDIQSSYLTVLRLLHSYERMIHLLKNTDC